MHADPSSPPTAAPTDATLRQRLCCCLLAHCSGAYERWIAPRKQALLADVSGDVLEIGPGIGANLPYLPRGIRYAALEPNPAMHPRLRRAAAEAGIGLHLSSDPAERSNLASASVDHIVCTLVLCSVNDPAAVVREMQRLLRPGGRLNFIEHVAARRGSWLRLAQRAVRPIWRCCAAGCRPNQETDALLSAAGFVELKMERFRVPFPIISPHIAGWARATWAPGA